MCVNHRGPNEVVIDSFPLPHIEESLNSVQGVSNYSKLDLASAYQVRLGPENRNLTAFITHEGLFHFKRAFQPGHRASCFSASTVKDFEKISWHPVLPG